MPSTLIQNNTVLEIDDESQDNNSTRNASKRSYSDSQENANKRIKADPKILDGTYYVVECREGTNVKAICTKCNSAKRGSVNGTGNFTKHYRLKHPELYEKMLEHISKASSQLSTTALSAIRIKSEIPPQEVSNCQLILLI